MATVEERHPSIFVERHEDPRKRTRTVPMEVLSLGMGRTGTMSMRAALQILGIPTWHWVTMSENPPDMAMWAEALRAKYEPQPGQQPFSRAEYDNLLGSWGASTDQPPHVLSEDLIAAYPEAKVILVERDVDRWYKSYSETVIESNSNPWIPLITLIDRVYIGRMAEVQDLVTRHYFGVREARTRFVFWNNPGYVNRWRAVAKDVYLRHNEMVKRVTPKERLLVYKLEDGWEPLCRFLNKPVPDVPFPRVNETLAAQEMVNTYILQGYKRMARKFVKRALPAMAAVVVGLAYWKGKAGRYNLF